MREEKYGIGARFGRLVVVEKYEGSRRRCVCDCGKQTLVYAENLNRDRTRSCGCLRDEVVKQKATTHGMSKTATYRIWRNMLNRCMNPHVPHWHRYGGRGITVAQRWLSFESFLADMGERPPGCSIDRYPDNCGHYAPGNCRWASAKQQGRNKRTNRLLTHNGMTQPLVAWAEQLGMASRTLQQRLQRGMPVAQALTQEVRHVMR